MPSVDLRLSNKQLMIFSIYDSISFFIRPDNAANNPYLTKTTYHSTIESLKHRHRQNFIISIIQSIHQEIHNMFSTLKLHYKYQIIYYLSCVLFTSFVKQSCILDSDVHRRFYHLVFPFCLSCQGFLIPLMFNLKTLQSAQTTLTHIKSQIILGLRKMKDSKSSQ